MDTSNKMLTLVSADEQRFELPVAAAALSEYILNACGRGKEEEEDGEDEPEPEEYRAVDVLRVSGPALSKVVDFMAHHYKEKMDDIPTPLGGNSFEEVRFVLL